MPRVVRLAVEGRAMKIIPLALLFAITNGVLWSQTRLNTDKLEAKVQQELTSSDKNLRNLEGEMRSLRDRARQNEQAKKQSQKRLQQLQAEIANLKKEKLGLFRSIIADLMNDPEVGHWFREEPNRFFLIPWIEEVIVRDPWLLDPVEEILNSYR